MPSKRLSLRRPSKKAGAAKKDTKAGSSKKPAKKKTSPKTNFMTESKEAWIAVKDERVWELAKVIDQDAGMLTMRRKSDKKVIQVPEKHAHPTNKFVEGDMTALHHIHEAGILHNLEQRSLENEPYTLMGPVLVAVNPLKRIPDPEGIIGKSKAASVPHPYAIAEVSYQQLLFASSHAKTNPESDTPVNQSIVVGGESGAGKTESSKMVLAHLVARCAGKSNLDKQLLGTNPILEAFGNATTLRNHNSSRFGKFMKLHLEHGKKVKLAGASVETYLLERSRVSAHGMGERNYHIFYQLIAGADKKLKSKFSLSKPEDFAYLRASGGDGNVVAKSRAKMNDKKDFAEVKAAFDSIGLSDKERETVFGIVAGVLHLGNFDFVDEERPEGDAAVIKKGNNSPDYAAELLGIKKDTLVKLFSERKVKSVGETIVALRNSEAALGARDAVAKTVYSKLFDWLIVRINSSLTLKDVKSVSSLPFIGVLDIFGFESFEHNDFEQLLINFTNEALQATFNKQVFEAEAELYRREGLVIDSSESIAMPKGNGECMDLLLGTAQPKTVGVLNLIDQEGRNPQPTDDKLINSMHRAFTGQKAFVSPHPRDRANKFIISHYAGNVQYTVGAFLLKNSDSLPNEVVEVFQSSTIKLVKELWGPAAGAGDDVNKMVNSLSGGRGAKRGNDSIVKKFNAQIQALVNTLDDTRCSFIRCVKPNWQMVRTDSPEWFNRVYITNQLKCLSIPQTASVLQTGLPTRILYSSLTEQYKKVLPKDALKTFKTFGGGDDRAFVSALFWAFEIPRIDYKLGLTRVFFRSGMLAKLEGVLNASNLSKEETKKISKRFKRYYTRTLWRKAYIKVRAVNYFTKLLEKAKGKAASATTIQTWFRSRNEHIRYTKTRKAAIYGQCFWRRHAAKAKLQKMRKEEIKRRQKEKARLAKEKAERKQQAKKEKEKLAAQKKKEKEAKTKEEKERLKKEKAEQEAKVKQLEEEAQKLEEKEQDTERKLQDAEDAERNAIEDAQKQEKKVTEALETANKKAKKKKEKEKEKVRRSIRRGDKDLRASVKLARLAQKESLNRSQSMAVVDRSAWKRPVSFFATKRARQRKRNPFSKVNWKRRFFVLAKESRTLTYFESGNPNSNRGDGQPKGTIFLDRAAKCEHQDDFEGKAFVLKITCSADKDHPLFIAFEDATQKEAMCQEILSSVSGFSMDVVEEDTGGYDLSHVDDVVMKRLMRLELMLSDGRIQQEDYDRLLEDAFQSKNDYPSSDEEGARNNPDSIVATVACSQCGTLNDTTNHTSCTSCSFPFEGVIRHGNEEEEKPMAKLPYAGGTVRIWVQPPTTYQDSSLTFHESYPLRLAWHGEDGREEHWTVSREFEVYHELHQNLVKKHSRQMSLLPKFPSSGMRKGISKSGRKTKGDFLRKWFQALFSIDKVLEMKVIVTMLALQENTMKWEEFQQLSESQNGLTFEEVNQLEEALTILDERTKLHGEFNDPSVLKLKKLLENSLPQVVKMAEDDATDPTVMAKAVTVMIDIQSMLQTFEDAELTVALATSEATAPDLPAKPTRKKSSKKLTKKKSSAMSFLRRSSKKQAQPENEEDVDGRELERVNSGGFTGPPPEVVEAI